MPKKIVPETRGTEALLEACAQHMPECNLSKKDVERFSKELTKYMKQFAPAFQRVEQVKHSKAYVHGSASSPIDVQTPDPYYLGESSLHIANALAAVAVHILPNEQEL